MFSRRKPEQPKRNHNLLQFGLTDEYQDPIVGTDAGDDGDLEEELAALAGAVHRDKPKIKSKLDTVPANEFDGVSVEVLNDDITDDDGCLENDAELLGELQGILGNAVNENDQPESISVEENKLEIHSLKGIVCPADIIKKRIEMYKIAEANSKTAGESAKMRRLDRGLKTLNDLLRQANLGKTVNPDDIPPEVSLKSACNNNIGKNDNTPKTEDSPKMLVLKAPLPPILPHETKDCEETRIPKMQQIYPLVQQMCIRQQEYKAAAIQSKRVGDTAKALQFLKIGKRFDVVIKMCSNGQEVDLSDMPPPPEHFKEFMESMLVAGEKKPASPIPKEESLFISEFTSPVEANTTTATNMLEALQQRLSKYKSVEESAKAEENGSKARRFGRIVKQYEDAIKAYKEGCAVVYNELPIPPGFGTLPSEFTVVPKPPKDNFLTPSPPTLSTVSSTPECSPRMSTKSPRPTQPNLTTRTSGNQQKNDLAEKQMKILIDRQQEFKVAAIDAKKAEEIDQAREYLKIYKGFDALLNAASSGLPVDFSTLPVPPTQRDNLESSFAIITTEECNPNGDISDIGVRIEEQLAKQLMMCKNTRDHHKTIGDIAGMNRFENLALAVQKDLDLVRYSKRQHFTPPMFHYEQRNFNIVHCNTDLTDNELQIIIVRGINYNVCNPKEVDTYVKIEFALLNDETFKAKTNLVKDTDSPDYDQEFKVEINRGSRQFQRIFKRHGVKFEVYSRGGFLRSDTLIGAINVKLQPLETKCDIHDTFDLVEGRKKVGGKLEIKLRVRNPILTKQMEHVNEKWLVIDT